MLTLDMTRTSTSPILGTPFDHIPSILRHFYQKTRLNTHSVPAAGKSYFNCKAATLRNPFKQVTKETPKQPNKEPHKKPHKEQTKESPTKGPVSNPRLIFPKESPKTTL